MIRPVAVLGLLLTTALAGCAGGGDDQAVCDAHGERSHPDNPRVRLVTSMGAMTVELYAHMTPVTVQNMLDLAPMYVDVPFHRIMTDFMMQGGDLSRAPGGGSAAMIPDEFHWALRHDCKGQLSMANAGRGTGSSQFFVTFGPAPHLDDRHTVFGQVVEGLSVVDRVNEEAASASGTPRTSVTLERVERISGSVPSPTTGAVDAFVFTPEVTFPADGGKAGVLGVVENLADHPVEVHLTADGGAATATVEPSSFTLPALQRRTVGLHIEATGPGTITLTATSGEASASTEVTLQAGEGPAGAGPQDGDEVTVHYIGATWDGRLFDTSIRPAADVASDRDLWFDLFGPRGAGGYRAATFPYGGTVAGFTDLVGSLREGEQGVSLFGTDEGYGQGSCQPGQPCVYGFPMAFQARLIEIP